MKKETINTLREFSRKLVRELGILQLSQPHLKKAPQHWHALTEIAKEPNITPSQLGILLLLSVSSTSRIVNALIDQGLVDFKEGVDKREKQLHLTKEGQLEVARMDEFSNTKIKGAFEFLTDEDQDQIVRAIQKYGAALEKSRLIREHVKIHTLSTSRTIRKQIMAMIKNIQTSEFLLAVTDEMNACILRAEEDFYYNNSYNFWYAVDENGAIIGSIGLKKIDDTTGEIKKFFVAQNYRGKGVAQKLMNALVKTASKHGFKSLYLGSVDVLHAAHAFYRKQGFSQITEKQLPAGFQKFLLDSVFFKGSVEEWQHTRDDIKLDE